MRYAHIESSAIGWERLGTEERGVPVGQGARRRKEVAVVGEAVAEIEKGRHEESDQNAWK